MRKLGIVAASMLVLSVGMLANVAVAQAPMVNGQVTKIDESAGKITLKHGPIKKLDMNEAMTMVFRVGLVHPRRWKPFGRAFKGLPETAPVRVPLSQRCRNIRANQVRAHAQTTQIVVQKMGIGTP